MKNAMKMAMAVSCILLAGRCMAVIPGFGPLYGENSTYVYNEYNCSTHDSRDQFFLNYLEYGLTDWAALQLQTINYPDGSYNDLSLGGAFQFWNAEWFALRGYATYDFGPGAPNAKADSMCYGLTGSGAVWNGIGYIYQVQCAHPCHGKSEKPNWKQQVYLTYDVTDRLTPYASVTADLRHVDRTTDFSVGGWYTVARDWHGIRWICVYFDVANLTEKYEDVRVSAGFDILF